MLKFVLTQCPCVSHCSTYLCLCYYLSSWSIKRGLHSTSLAFSLLSLFHFSVGTGGNAAGPTHPLLQSVPSSPSSLSFQMLSLYFSLLVGRHRSPLPFPRFLSFSPHILDVLEVFLSLLVVCRLKRMQDIQLKSKGSERSTAAERLLQQE